MPRPRRGSRKSITNVNVVTWGETGAFVRPDRDQRNRIHVIIHNAVKPRNGDFSRILDANCSQLLV